jgi:hypothetical protein
MGLYGSEKRQALPEELSSIIDGLMLESRAISAAEIRGNEEGRFRGFAVSRFQGDPILVAYFQ